MIKRLSKSIHHLWLLWGDVEGLPGHLRDIISETSLKCLILNYTNHLDWFLSIRKSSQNTI